MAIRHTYAGKNGHTNTNRLDGIFSADEKEFSKALKAIIKAKSANQKNYIRTIRDCDITCCVGPAGSGKTACAIGVACYLLSKGHVDRIILTRPIVPCDDEDLGFLPGDMEDKVAPYLRPMFDELHEFFTAEQIRHFRQGECPAIEIAPLAFIKGRTFKRSIMILDEAQDATYKQIRKFLTRMGEGSKIVLAGDVTQSDLSDYKNDRGLEQIMRKLEGMEGVGFARLDPSDIVRHHLIAKILERI